MEHKARARSLRVANIIEEGRLGGPQVRIANVARALQPEIETTVILPRKNSEHFRSMLEGYKVPYRAFPLSRITREPGVALCYLLFSWYEILELVRYFKKEKFDLVHVSGGAWQYKGVIAGRLAGLKVAWHLNDTSSPQPIRKLFEIANPLADAFIFASKRSQYFYQPLLKKGKAQFVIPAPVETRLFDPEKQFSLNERLKDKLAGKVVIGTVANINPIKDLKTFIKAASILNAHCEGLHFIVTGAIFRNQEGYYDELVELCRDSGVDNIEFTGPVTDVRPVLGCFDVYICSSRAESSPISVWEALSMGKPVVSTDVGDVAIYVKDNINGFIVDIGDAASLAQKVLYLVEHKNIRKEFGERARKTAVERLDIRRCVRLYRQAYNQIANN